YYVDALSLHDALPISRVIQGEYRVTQHLMFECLVEAAAGARSYLGLNEASIQTGPPFHMLDLELIIDGETVSHYGGDGLIISTRSEEHTSELQSLAYL